MPVSIKDGKSTVGLNTVSADAVEDSGAQSLLFARRLSANVDEYIGSCAYNGYDYIYTGCTLAKRVNGAWTTLGNAAWSGGDISLECIGSSIKLYDGTTLRISVTDTSLPNAADWTYGGSYAINWSLVSYDSAGGSNFPAAPLSHRPITFGRR